MRSAIGTFTTLSILVGVAAAQPGTGKPAPPPVAPSKGLNRAQISEAMAKVKPQIAACGDRAPAASGMLKLKIKVAPSGTVEIADALATPDKAIGECAVAIMKAATFAPTEAGGSFSYPFVFTAVQENLDRAAISAGIAKIKPAVMECGTKHTVKGKVKAAVMVGPDGKVTTVEIKETPAPELGACVASAIQAGTFKKTRKGGSFTYPFVF